MEPTKNTNENTLEITLIMAFAQLSNQLLEFQRSITQRGAENCFPTFKEIGMICRLVNCLAKLKKLADPFNGQKAITAFATFLAKQDKELGKTIKAKYREYLASNQQSAQETEADQSVDSNASVAETLLETPPPPVSKEDFDQHKGLLHNLHINQHHTTNLNGQQRNTHWLQYNLFQWHLPRAERRFCHNENEYHTTINHTEVCRKIKQHHTRNIHRK